MQQEAELTKQVTHSPHSAYIINYHLVWIPHYRKKVLVGPVEARLKALLAEIAMPYGFEILAVEVLPRHACRDHMLLFVSAPPSERSSAFAPADRSVCSRGCGMHTHHPVR